MMPSICRTDGSLSRSGCREPLRVSSEPVRVLTDPYRVSEIPQIFPLLLRTVSNVPFDSLYPHCIKYLQLEEEEILHEDEVDYPASPPVHIGDIGHFSTGSEGQRDFRVISNAASDMIDFKLGAWWGNHCFEICETCHPRVWCSPWIQPGESSTLRFNWTVDASSRLPRELRQFYLFWVTSNGGTQKPVDENLKLVTRVVHQVQAQIPSDFSSPARLYVHFDEQHQPCRAYWLENCEGEPWHGKVELPQGSSRGIIIRPGISHNIIDSALDGKRDQQPAYRKRDSTQPATPAQRDPTDCQPGDVGYWARDREGRITAEWIVLRKAQFSVPEIKTTWLHTSMSKNGIPCKEAGPRLYWSRRFDPTEADTIKPVHYRWVQAIARYPPSFFSEALESVVEDVSVPPGDILLVTSVTTDVYAVASEEALRPHIDLYKKLRLYTFFPPGGGCDVYWSRHDHTKINMQALVKLDLEKWQLSGCDARKSIKVERKSLLELSGPTTYRPMFLDHKFGARVRDYGWDVAAHFKREGRELPAISPPVVILGNMFDNRGNRDLKIVHGSERGTPCSELSPGTWTSDLTVDASPATGTHGGRWWWKATLDDIAIIDDVCYIADTILRSKADIKVSDLRICTGTKITVDAKPPESKNRATEARLVGRIGAETPLQASFQWCSHHPLCENDESCSDSSEQPRIEASYEPIIKPMEYFKVGAELMADYNYTVVPNEDWQDAMLALFMEAGFVEGSDDTLYLDSSSSSPAEWLNRESTEQGGFKPRGPNLSIW